MSRQALKEVLLDLKAQMRGARASSYKKKDKDEPEDAPKPRKADDKPDDDMDDSDKGSKADKADPVEDKPAPVDFSDEIRSFMKKRNKGKSHSGPSARVSIPDVMKKAPAPEAPKKKGK